MTVKFKPGAENELKVAVNTYELGYSQAFFDGDGINERKKHFTLANSVFLSPRGDGHSPDGLRRHVFLIWLESGEKMDILLIKGKRSEGSYTMDIDPVGMVKLSTM